jgi:hypothetical protein
MNTCRRGHTGLSPSNRPAVWEHAAQRLREAARQGHWNGQTRTPEKGA